MSFSKSIITHRNVAGAFIKPNCMTSNLNVLCLIVNAVKSLHSSETGIFEKKQKRSIVVKYVNPPRRCNISSMLGSRKVSAFILAFKSI